MAIWATLTLLCTASSLTVAKYESPQNDTPTMPTICDTVTSATNNTNKIQCYCVRDTNGLDIVKSADCYITEDLRADDKNWELFSVLEYANKLTLTNSRGITLKYIPTKALKRTGFLTKIDVKYSTIQKIESFAFANLSNLQEISLRDNQIEVLVTNAFAHHKNLTTIGLDKNNIVEINRDVFVDLPSLQKLFLTSNKITTLHDRAFVHLGNLKELEIDRNGLFSLNSETFSGLKNLQKLDLSSNSLEVIGDNTFLPLVNLIILNLEGNKIQMLDEKAFNGLWRLRSLSLGRNKLTAIENVKIFHGLDTLSLLSLRENGLCELKPEVLAPILSNFYGVSSNLDVEGNNFHCDCHLDWFLTLMNKTQNNRLKLAIENLQCHPEPEIRDLYMKTEEAEKNNGQVFEDEEPQAQNTDYEYYDVSQLNGKLFYIDMRHLLNCTKPVDTGTVPSVPTVPSMPTVPSVPATPIPQVSNEIRTESNPKRTKETPAPAKSVATTQLKSNKVTNYGVLNLNEEESTTKTVNTTPDVDDPTFRNAARFDQRANQFTTSRLATVSAKPLDDKKTYDEREMAADEAKPEQYKSHIMQEDVKKTGDFNKGNNAQIHLCCVTMLSVVVSVVLCL